MQRDFLGLGGGGGNNIKKILFYFPICLIQNMPILTKNKAVHLLKQIPQTNIINYGLPANMYTKAKAFDQNLFLSKSEAAIHYNSHYHRQRSFVLLHLHLNMRGSRGGDRGSGTPLNLKILPKKGNFGIFWGLDPPPPSSVTKNYHFRWTPSHENFWIRACLKVVISDIGRST